MADKVFLKCSAKAKHFANGGSVINVGVKVEDLAEFCRKHKNERGYLNLVIQERREVGQFGDTHSIVLDTYQPKPRETGTPSNAWGNAPDADSIPF